MPLRLLRCCEDNVMRRFGRLIRYALMVLGVGWIINCSGFVSTADELPFIPDGASTKTTTESTTEPRVLEDKQNTERENEKIVTENTSESKTQTTETIEKDSGTTEVTSSTQEQAEPSSISGEKKNTSKESGNTNEHGLVDNKHTENEIDKREITKQGTEVKKESVTEDTAVDPASSEKKSDATTEMTSDNNAEEKETSSGIGPLIIISIVVVVGLGIFGVVYWKRNR